NLILNPEGVPDVQAIDKMSNSMSWLLNNSERVATATRRINANGQYHVLKDVLGIDKPEWAPDKVADKDLEAYGSRMGEALDLMFKVRNYGEAMMSLDKVEGDFNSKEAIQALEKIAGVKIDPENKRITKLDIKLPDSLTADANNDKVFQDMRD